MDIKLKNTICKDLQYCKKHSDNSRGGLCWVQILDASAQWSYIVWTSGHIDAQWHTGWIKERAIRITHWLSSDTSCCKPPLSFSQRRPHSDCSSHITVTSDILSNIFTLFLFLNLLKSLFVTPNVFKDPPSVRRRSLMSYPRHDLNVIVPEIWATAGLI